MTIDDRSDHFEETDPLHAFTVSIPDEPLPEDERVSLWTQEELDEEIARIDDDE